MYYETALTNGGRGRLPHFFNQYKCLWAAEKKYNYLKLRGGSFKHFVPSHYELGYILVTYGREKYGEDFWKKVADKTLALSFSAKSWRGSIKKYTGKSYKSFLDDAFNFFKEKSILKDKDKRETELTKPVNNNVTDYYSPYFLSSDSIIVIKKDNKNLPAFYILTRYDEKRLIIRDLAIDDYFDYNDTSKNIVYSTFQPDKRWNNYSYNNIRVLNINTKKINQITNKGKYFSPSFSSDGTKIVAVNIPLSQQTHLHILNTENGALIKEIPNTDKLFFTYPRFFNEQKIVAAVRDSSGKMAIALINSENGKVEYLTTPGYIVVNSPFVKTDTVYFAASEEKSDNIFGVDIKTKNIFRLTNTGIGNYQPSVKNNQLLYTKLTANGYMMASQQVAPQLLTDEALKEFYQLKKPYSPNLFKRYESYNIDNAPYKKYTAQDYNKFKGLFNFHSWLPSYARPQWNVTLMGQNVLNTFQSQLSYTFNENEKSHKIGFDGLLSVWYPIIHTAADYTFNRTTLINNNKISWDELNIKGGFLLPFNLTKGKWYSFLNMSSSYNFNRLFLRNTSFKPLFTSFSYLNSSVRYGIFSQQALQHIYPRWALVLESQYKNAISSLQATQWLNNLTVNVPGFASTHNFMFTGSFQIRDTNNQYRFSNNFPFSRGYTATPDYHNMWRGSINYHFPIIHPDVALADFLYVMRLRGNIFYDHSTIKDRIKQDRRSFRSTGVELIMDNKIGREWMFPVSIGVRYSRLLDNEVEGKTSYNRWEFIFPVNL